MEAFGMRGGVGRRGQRQMPAQLDASVSSESYSKRPQLRDAFL